MKFLSPIIVSILRTNWLVGLISLKLLRVIVIIIIVVIIMQLTHSSIKTKLIDVIIIILVPVKPLIIGNLILFPCLEVEKRN